MAHTVEDEMKSQSIRYMDECTERIGKCLDELTEEQVWQRPNENSNSVGNLVVHLQGNITQYILSSLGEHEDTRDRPGEFAMEGGQSKVQLWNSLQKTVDDAKEIIEALSTSQLLQKRHVQGFHYTGVANVIHVVEHFSYHTGQIVFWVKQLKNMDMNFYGGRDLTAKNQSS